MYIYNPINIKQDRIKKAEAILKKINLKHCFISGSFLWKDNYKDIDIFTITRKNTKFSKIDFNDLYSLFYHSVSKCCISKNILPDKPLKVTLADFWSTINETVPEIFNNKKNFKKHLRSLILYTEYFKNNYILDTYELNGKIQTIKTYKQAIDMIRKEIPKVIAKNAKPSYLKRFFYTQSGFYKDSEYKAQNFLYDLCHSVVEHGLA